jgi:AcrR family transcriptional regulator
MEHEGECLGLRERKKLATREALSHAAVRLALASGPENVRVPDIAAEVGVSPRTYNNYFSSVAEAICAEPAARAMGLGDEVRARPDSESLAEAVGAAMTIMHHSSTFNKELVRMIITTPMLRGEFFKTFVARDNSLAEAIAERVNRPFTDLYPHILAATYSSAARVCTHRWLQDDNADFLAMLREAMDMIAPMTAAYERQARQAA